MAKTKTKAKAKERDRDEDRPDRSDRPQRPQARNDAYVVMLLVTFFAILAGCVMLYLDNDQYGGQSPPKAVIPALTDLGGDKVGEPKGGGT
jgi:hypothetical protein